MIPIVTPEEMADIDADAPEPVDVLIDRAGSAVARAALRLLGGAYGRRVVVVAGKGNNGNDGRSAASRLRRRGVRIVEVDPTGSAVRLPDCDLVIDAAFGTGFRGEWEPPDPGGAPVLAVDIPSGVDGLTGEAPTGAMKAVATVTFAALKPGLLLGRGAELAGELEVVDIGLDVSRATAHVVEDSDVRGWLPSRSPSAHKWQSAVWVVAGSAGMTGAARLAARAAQRAGAGYVRLSVPGADEGADPIEAVGTRLPAERWSAAVLEEADRFGAVLVGPGLARADHTMAEVRELVSRCPVPIVVDGDGLSAIESGRPVDLDGTVVLTPHDGEFARLAGGQPGPDRLAAARDLASRTGGVVALKGATLLVADPDGRVLAVSGSDGRLATAGSGDVLAGATAALLAQGLAASTAPAAAAHIGRRAAALGWRRGLVAGDVAELLPAALEELDRSL